jgi:hypothetical protein
MVFEKVEPHGLDCLDVIVIHVTAVNIIIREIEKLLRGAADGFQKFHLVLFEHCCGALAAVLLAIHSREKQFAEIFSPVIAHG